MSRIASIGTGCPLAMSANWRTPPGRAPGRSRRTGLFVGTQVDDAVGDDGIGPPAFDGHRFRQPFAELDMADLELHSGRSCLVEHLAGHVDPDDLAGRSDLTGGDERVESGTRADVDYPFARIETSQGERVADPGERLDGTVRQCIGDALVVAEAGGEGSAGVEVMGAIRVEGDVAVLVLYLRPQGVDIDEYFVGHGRFSLSGGDG
jgi:hypothetical protein